MNQLRSNFGITHDSVRNELYVFGGYGVGFLDHCEKYSVEEDVWTEVEPMNRTKYGVTACIVDSQSIFLIGGYDDTYKALDDIEKYSITCNTWQTIFIKDWHLFPPRFLPFSFQTNTTYIIVGGGFDDGGE